MKQVGQNSIISHVKLFIAKILPVKKASEISYVEKIAYK